MADLQKTVEIVFGGRNELSSTIGEIESSLGKLESGTQVFSELATDILAAELAVVGLATAFAGLTISEAGTYADSFAEITTLISDNEADLEGYSDSILDYANNSTQSLESINGAVYSAISAGTDYTDALDLMSTAESLAVAGKADLNSTLVALASTMNAYGADVSEANDYSDVFFTTVKQGQTTIPELAASLSQVTSTASAAGVPFDDLSAAIAALTAGGMTTSSAITSIKAALSNIISPSTEAATLAEELGVQFSATALKTQGLQGFLESLYTATGGNIETMASLFGSTEALNAVMSLSADSSGIFADSMEAMETRADAASTAFEKMADNFELNNQKLVNNMQTVLIGIGGELLDEYTDIVDALVANMQGIGSALSAGDLDGMIGIFESAMSDISGLLEGIADVLPEALANINWDGLEGSFDNLKESVSGAFATIFGDLDLDTVEGVTEGIQTLVNLLSGLTNTASGVIDGLSPLFTAIGTLAEKFVDADEKGQEFAGEIIGIGTSVNQITGFLSTATSTVGGLSTAMLTLAGSNVFSGIASLVTKFGSAGLSGALTTASTAATTLGVGLAAIGGYAVGTAVNEVINDVTQTFSESETLGELVYDWLHDGDSYVSSGVAAFADSIMGIPLSVETATGKVWENSFQINTEPAEESIVEIQEIIDPLPTEVEQVARDMSAIVWDLDEDGNLAQFSEEIKQNLADIEAAAKQVSLDDLTQELIDMGNSPAVASAMANIQLEVQKVPAAVDDAAKQVEEKSEDLIIALANIASDERIAAMELSVDLDIAQLEADTETMSSLIDGVGTTIESTTSLISDMVGAFTDVDSFSDKWYIQDLIDEQTDLQQDAFDLQEKLTNAQVELINARTEALQNGDSMITVTGDGLEAELEAFMWKILEKVQLRASESYSSFLLGIDT
jgi:TP901 family phage tail tape measure protein